MKKCSNKFCKSFNILINDSHFSKDKYAKDGLNNWCKQCIKEYRSRPEVKQKTKLREKLYYSNTKNIKENNRLFKKFSITLQDYNELLKLQNYRCKICGIDENNCKKGLEIDHCHKTNKIRGLLCMECNTGLGKFKDNKEFLKEAINYLNSGSELMFKGA